MLRNQLMPWFSNNLQEGKDDKAIVCKSNIFWLSW